MCKAMLHTLGMIIVKKNKRAPPRARYGSSLCLETKSGIKRKAQQTQDSTHHIVGENLATVTQNAAIKLPKIDSLKRTIRRQRQIINHAYPQPLTLADLVLPLEYQQTTKGDQSHSNRFIIFGTHQIIEMLRNSQIWLADDGTFKSTPALFAQVYVIHSLRGGTNPLEDGHLSPCLFVLLPNKTEAVYLRMWKNTRSLYRFSTNTPNY